MESSAPHLQSADTTRDALVAAGLRLFGARGFDGTSTREIAALAGTNVASIAYHFGSKAGLRASCARAIAERVAGIVGRPERDAGTITPEGALARLEGFVRALAEFLVAAPDAEDTVSFVLREMTEDAETVATLYDSILGPKHRELCVLWGRATDLPAESERVRLAVFAMIGQVAYFRIGRAVVQRRMEWDTIGPAQADAVADTLVAVLRGAVQEMRK